MAHECRGICGQIGSLPCLNLLYSVDWEGGRRRQGDEQMFPKIISNSNIINKNKVMCLEGAWIDRQHFW